MNTKTALIFGVTGQDGMYLSELLLSKGYIVHGIKRKSSSINTDRINHIYDTADNFYLHYGDLSDTSSIIKLLQKIKPDEIYNLGAMSHVAVSFELPEYTANVDGLGVLRILEAVKILDLDTKIYQASTSELYGKVLETPQNENTPFYPRSPYAVSKLYAYWTIINYREAYGIFTCNGILFNHESPVRGETFVTRKITKGIVDIVLNKIDKLHIGNLNAKRDWGHAKDYVEAMWLMMQYDKPEDWVISSGRTNTVREFIILAFKRVGIEIEFKGSGSYEKGYVKSVTGDYKLNIGKEILCVDNRYFRPTEVDILIGDSSKAKRLLNWESKHSLEDIVNEMVDSDLLEGLNNE